MSTAIRERIDRLLDRINAISAPGPGFTRPSYSPLESQAHRVVAQEAEALGLTVTRDAALNLFARLPGRDRSAPAIYCGSHLDTVAMGGAYDGQAGVTGALALAAAFVESGEPPPVDLMVTVTRAEESVWFPVSYAGARAALGRLTAPELQARRSDTGRTLYDHIREEGGRPDDILTAAGLAAARFIELHIEQGTVLHHAGEPFAIVSGVRGGLRYRQARVNGTWAHSGGPARGERADAVFALADLVMAMDRRWEEALARGQDLAVTFGRVDAASGEHAFAKVPGWADFCIDLRSDAAAVLHEVDGLFKAEIERIETARGVRFELGAPSQSQPMALSIALGDRIAQGAAGLGHSPRRMLSGGGHDAAAFAQAGWESVMVFLRNWNGSHNPDEAMDTADLATAVEVLHAAIRGSGQEGAA
ncbi:Zn-dependent hydrolase [Xaviernesmea oryzae]|uniref:Zn-dependent hydrolase n=1 Tax=Xaviernesmea oryzae TaxID=464029 RepID=A0A1Q9ARB1_9HYPH|nr:hydantoinase/carbamoylase family amidase [Xaviernesmea oryzae]OLP57921.1 Zn-dependent hydrolase [Xaviernesmea oryzae]SEL30769.1 N-carbamoyl-L-amino-acid hydrolase [Xaviernesmea oryzae]